jgi:hypothetical protein
MYIFGELISLTSTTAAMNCANRPPNLPTNQPCKGIRCEWRIEDTSEDCDVQGALGNIELSDASCARTSARGKLSVEMEIKEHEFGLLGSLLNVGDFAKGAMRLQEKIILR